MALNQPTKQTNKQSLKKQALELLQHIEESISHWNLPIFIKKKESENWRLLTDLRAVNRVI